MLGVIGHPVGHTLSPRMHNAAFAASGPDYLYLPMDVRPEDLPAAVSGLRALGFRGFNVTMPHKEAILPLLDELDEAARAAGAVNTVTIEERGMRGSNTDGSGFVEACERSGLTFAGARVVLVGAGGAAAAIAVAVLGEGVREVRILNRSRWRAERLRDTLRSAYPEAGISVHDTADPGGAAREADAVVNATYLGMREDDPLPLPAGFLGGDMVVCDAVYRPGGETRFIALAKERGLRVVPGGRMLLYQGVQAQRIWTGKEPDVPAMSDALSM
ncbi:MAG TPA: shikimate dehydrogenase [Rubrobacteraceae bacterium]|nr:shikimate dehydrogenase [Rubrobacteraceae bacterium]